MIIIENFAEVTAQFETERGISRIELIAAVQQAPGVMSASIVLEATIAEATGAAFEARFCQDVAALLTNATDLRPVSADDIRVVSVAAAPLA